MEERNLSQMTFPRYVPFMGKGTPAALWYDTREKCFIGLCPRCRRLAAYGTVEAACKELGPGRRQGCQGCRARDSFELDPGLVDVFVDFWTRTGKFPESPSWMEAIPLRALRRGAKPASPAEGGRAGKSRQAS